MNKLTEWLTKPFLEEDINIPVKVGDTILGGKFKNKKMKIKDIGKDKHGMPTINGRKATTFRIHKTVNIFDKEEVTEGVNDPGIFKAVFLAGGPGSGKSYVASQLFGIPEKINTSAYGLKLVNQDTELENFLKKYFGYVDIDKMPDELFKNLTDPKSKDYSGMRTRTKALSKKRLELYKKGRLGVIIDGTGHKFKEVKKQRKELMDLGYDTFMVFVNTSLEIAQKRNEERDRVLPAGVVEKYWHEVQKNMAVFQGMFGNANFLLVDNNKHLSPKQARKKFNMLVSKGIGKFIKRPMKNKIAKMWVDKQKIVKESIGLVGGDGTISGAPDPKTVKKVKKQVDKQKKDLKYTDTFSLQHLNEFINKPKMKKALQKLIDKNLIPKMYAKNTRKLQVFLTNNPMVMTQLLRLLGENINENDKAQLMKLYTKAMKMMPHSPAQKKVKKQIDALRKKLKMSEETSKIKKVVGIYAGRFQPFGPHHKKVYEWLKKQFDDAYITTSDIKKPPKHPMNFKEKKRHMLKMGIPSNKIVKEKQPYVAVNTLKKFDKDTTAVVYVFGKKDADRLKGGTKKSGGKTYYQDYKKNKNNLVGHDKHGYILTAPHFSIQAGGMEVSGTAMRQLLGSPKYADDRERRFKKFFGYFDKGVYNMMTNKFSKLFGEEVVISKELIEDFLVDVDVSKILKESTAQINAPVDDGPPTFYKGFGDYKRESEKWINSMFEDTGWVVLNHVLSNKAHDPAFDYTLNYRFMPTPSYGTVGIKGRQSERSLHNKYKERLNFVLSNLGFEVIKWMGLEDGEVRVQPPVLPGADEGTVNTDLKESKLFSKDWWSEELLLEGGAYGHMNHPFDDKNLTFGDLKKIIELGLGGELDREDGVTEKLDGQNLMISWKDGKLVTARNKGQLKNFGANSMDIKGVASKFAGRGDIKDAFVFAMKDLGKSIGSLSDKQKEKVFGNGKMWMNLEVMWPKSANVINYDKAEIIFHGTLEYDDSGNAIGQPKGSARMLAGMIKQVNQHIQKHYKIGKPQFLTVPKSQNFGSKKKTFLGRLNKLQKEFGLKNNDTLSMYHQSYWEEYIYNAAKQFKYKISKNVLHKLTRRWAFFDKSYSIRDMKSTIKNDKFLNWVLTTDKVDHQKMVKQNMRPFEVLFFAVGTEILKNIKGYLAVSPDKAVQKIRKDVISAINTVKKSKDIKKLETLKHQVGKLNSIGGLKSIVPSEGIVFKYKGNTYKFTGAFAPVNQIVGLLNF